MNLAPKRPPDVVIGRQGGPYLNRWFLVPRNRWFNVYLHQFLRDDDDRALHDHPWWSVSIVLRGGYYDISPGPDGTEQRRWYGPGSVIIRQATSRHRVELAERREHVALGDDGKADLPVGVPLEWDEREGRFVAFHSIPAWTLFITGPRVREWGFWCPQGWVHWRKFTAGARGESIGKGCDQ
jgi:hypothetical protein